MVWWVASSKLRKTSSWPTVDKERSATISRHNTGFGLKGVKYGVSLDLGTPRLQSGNNKCFKWLHEELAMGVEDLYDSPRRLR